MNLKKLKKAELHLHLDGSLRPESVLDIAKKDGIYLPTYNLEELIKYLRVEEGNKDLIEYLKKFDIPQLVLQSKENLERAAFELVEDLAKENYIYVEIRFAPHFHLNKGLLLDEVVEAVIKGVERAEEKYDIQANLLLCIMRHLNSDKGYEIIDLAKRFKGKKVVGIDLAGDEFNYSALLFKEVFAKAKKENIPFTIHAGEARGVKSIKEALECGATRLGHGIRAYEDQDLLKELKDKNIILECCPISNFNTNAIDDFYKYPLKDYVDNSILACLNTDNRTVSNTNYMKELEFLNKYKPMEESKIALFSLNAIKGAFINEHEKRALIEKLYI